MSATLEDGSITQLLQLIKETCTVAAVQELLREAKSDNPTVLVSGAKDTVIDSNLRVAIETDAISTETVYKLLCSAEENGRQHIFFYRTNGEQKAKYDDADAIAVKIFGENWRQQRSFPQFHLAPKGVEWSDFRIEKKNDAARWTAKLYSGIYRRKFVREEKIGEGLISRVYEEKLTREVYVIRWHSAGLLEVRVPDDPSGKTVIEFLTQLWEVIGPAVDQDDFTAWELHEVCMRLITNADKDSRYSLGNARMVDEETGVAEFRPPHSETDLRSSEARRSAVKLYNECRELGVHWLEKGEDGPRKKLRTIIGKLKPHEVLITGKADAEGVDYVIYRLLEAYNALTGAGSSLKQA